MLESKKMKKPRIGIYSMGLKHYWKQFPGLRERLIEYGEFISRKVEQFGAEVFFMDWWIASKPASRRANILTPITYS